MSEENVEIVRRGTDAYNRRDLARVVGTCRIEPHTVCERDDSGGNACEPLVDEADHRRTLADRRRAALG
jgi:hypothetical protein